VSPARASARAFVALPLGRELGAAVAERCAERLESREFRAPRAEGLHLTLYFLGAGARARMEGMASALRGALAGVRAPALRLGGAGAFPSLARPRVLWVGVEEPLHPGRLAECRRAVLRALAGAGVDTRAEEGREFHAHVTVARPRARGARPARFGGLELGLHWSPEGVELLESLPGPGGSRYECLERFPFAAE